MRIEVPANSIPNPLLVLRKAGYTPFRDPITKEESFVIKLTPEYYPRFHLYLKNVDEQTIFDVHLDQKKPSYGDTNKHSGEYEGPVIEKEAERIKGWIRHFQGSREL